MEYAFTFGKYKLLKERKIFQTFSHFGMTLLFCIEYDLWTYDLGLLTLNNVLKWRLKCLRMFTVHWARIHRESITTQDAGVYLTVFEPPLLIFWWWKSGKYCVEVVENCNKLWKVDISLQNGIQNFVIRLIHSWEIVLQNQILLIF